MLEDDCRVELAGGPLQLLALLQELVASAAEQEPEWQLLLLTPHGLEPFDLCQPDHIPNLIGDACPAWARKPKRLGDSGWKRVGPTLPRFWLGLPSVTHEQAVRRDGGTKAPPLNPLDVWVWEVMAANEMLGKALATRVPLVMTNDMPGGPWQRARSARPRRVGSPET